MKLVRPADDALLWEQFRYGDAGSLGELVSTHYTALLRYGTKFSRDTDFVRDCMQGALFMYDYGLNWVGFVECVLQAFSGTAQPVAARKFLLQSRQRKFVLRYGQGFIFVRL